MKGKTARKKERKKGRNLIAVVRGCVYDRDAYLSMTVRLFFYFGGSSSAFFFFFSVCFIFGE
jgi:hypothetical protein